MRFITYRIIHVGYSAILVIFEMNSAIPAYILLCTVELLFSRNNALNSTSYLRSKAYLISVHLIVYMCTVYMHVCKYIYCTSCILLHKH